jgi:predicted DNA-binding protein (MmcQ/YjbR family)
MRTRASFETFVSSLPGVTLVEQWGCSCAKVGGKVFALIGLDTHDVVFKVGEVAFAGLTSLPRIRQAAYFAKGQWVNVGKGALPDADLKAYLRESHRLVANGLTRKLRAELGLG